MKANAALWWLGMLSLVISNCITLFAGDRIDDALVRVLLSAMFGILGCGLLFTNFTLSRMMRECRRDVHPDFEHAEEMR